MKLLIKYERTQKLYAISTEGCGNSWKTTLLNFSTFAIKYGRKLSTNATETAKNMLVVLTVRMDILPI